MGAPPSYLISTPMIGFVPPAPFPYQIRGGILNNFEMEGKVEKVEKKENVEEVEEKEEKIVVELSAEDIAALEKGERTYGRLLYSFRYL